MAPDTAGHLFVVQADIRRLNADAWMLPTDTEGTVEAAWLRGEEELSERVATWQRSHRESNRGRVSYLPRGRSGEPSVIMAAIPSQGTTSAQYHLETVERAIGLLRSSPVASAKRLTLAVPALGTGASGAASVKGGVFTQLVRGLRRLAKTTGVDIMLVLRDRKAASAARAIRRSDESVQWWPTLSPESMDKATELASLALQGKLTLFTGAGISVAAGLPSWAGLLEELEAIASNATGRVLPTRDLSAVDRATLIADALGEEEMLREMQNLFSVSRYSVQHALLANLPVREAVTLNYDRLLEQAAQDMGRPFQVLPYEPSTDRWLLKLHGDIGGDGTSRDVVLTRSDYLGASDHRAALTGLVQAVLTTRHLLFVGFGLRDDHVHALIYDVRRALGRPQGHRFGTALLVNEDPVLELLWQKDLEVRALPDANGDRAGRHIEIFLDYLANASDPSYFHLFDDAWAGVLTGDEPTLRDLVRRVAQQAALHASTAWAPLREALRAYGWDEQPSPVSPLARTQPGLAAGRYKGQGAPRLRALIERGLLLPGEELLANWGRERVSAILLGDGRIQVNGTTFPAPSSAGQSITGHAVNGWAFWLVPRHGNRTLEQVENLPRQDD